MRKLYLLVSILLMQFALQAENQNDCSSINFSSANQVITVAGLPTSAKKIVKVFNEGKVVFECNEFLGDHCGNAITIGPLTRGSYYVLVNVYPEHRFPCFSDATIWIEACHNQGLICNDYDPCTEHDRIDEHCNCAGTPIPNCPSKCNTVGHPCNDGNPCTQFDSFNENCECVGVLVSNCPPKCEVIGLACNDGDPCTEHDTFNADCECVGTPVPNCPSKCNTVGHPCNDGNPCTQFDSFNENCECVGVLVSNCPPKCEVIGLACNDGDPCTEHDTFNADCECVGTPVPNCPSKCNTVGHPCNDGNPCTQFDSFNADCECVGTPVPNCPSKCNTVGHPCNDGNPCTQFDSFNADCECVGIPVSNCPPKCEVIGLACNDGNPCTQFDSFNENCECVGILVSNCPPKCEVIGLACNDGDPCTEHDSFNADCECVGTPIQGCGNGGCRGISFRAGNLFLALDFNGVQDIKIIKIYNRSFNYREDVICNEFAGRPCGRNGVTIGVPNSGLYDISIMFGDGTSCGFHEVFITAGSADEVTTRTGSEEPDVVVGAAEEFNIFPNPTNSVLNVDFGNTDIEVEYQVFDVSGRTILLGNSSSNQEISVSDWKPGVYIFRATMPSGTQNKRFIVY